jgi:hypothetical protein
MVQRYGISSSTAAVPGEHDRAVVAPAALLVTGVVVFLTWCGAVARQPPPPGASPRRAEIEKLLDGP